MVPTTLLTGAPLSEHYQYHNGGLDLKSFEAVNDLDKWREIYFQGHVSKKCVSLERNWSGKRSLQTSYYVGADWLEEGLAIYVEPKLNEDARQTDYFKMLFAALSNSEVTEHLSGLFQMKPDLPFIALKDKQDLLTPLLVLRFLQIVQHIVRKGLKRSYYTVTQSLQSRVKGKILVGATIKQNTLKNKPLNTVCAYSEFGFNTLENRILKKALVFVSRYLNNGLPKVQRSPFDALFNYVMPAFSTVSDDASLPELKATKFNPFFKEYREGLHLARLILQRYGYNINTASDKAMVHVPPFWIDMSKLFELYVLAEIKRIQPEGIHYQFSTGDSMPDYLCDFPGRQMIIDAKYKPKYDQSHDTADIRQLSGYARNRTILSKLGYTDRSEQTAAVAVCLFVYPDQSSNTEALPSIDQILSKEISSYTKFYKVPIKLPEQPVC